MHRPLVNKWSINYDTKKIGGEGYFTISLALKIEIKNRKLLKLNNLIMNEIFCKIQRGSRNKGK